MSRILTILNVSKFEEGWDESLVKICYYKETWTNYSEESKEMKQN